MTTKLMLDKAARMLAPKPPRAKALLKRECGVWVYQGEPTDTSVIAVIDNVRKSRLRGLNR
jgi:hypothetical protein